MSVPSSSFGTTRIKCFHCGVTFGRSQDRNKHHRLKHNSVCQGDGCGATMRGSTGARRRRRNRVAQALLRPYDQQTHTSTSYQKFNGLTSSVSNGKLHGHPETSSSSLN